MAIDLSRFRDTFLEEAAEHTATIEQSLLALEEVEAPRELLDAIFRAAHSIKGGSGAFGFADITHFTHALESVLDRMREGRHPHDRPTINLLLAANDVLKALVDAARRDAEPPANMPEIRDRLDALLTAMPEPTSEATPFAPAAPAETLEPPQMPAAGRSATGSAQAQTPEAETPESAQRPAGGPPAARSAQARTPKAETWEPPQGPAGELPPATFAQARTPEAERSEPLQGPAGGPPPATFVQAQTPEAVMPAPLAAMLRAPMPVARRVRIRFRPSADILRQGLDPLVILRELAEHGAVESIDVDTVSLPPFPPAGEVDRFDPESCYLIWTLVLATSTELGTLRDVFLFAEDGAEIAIEVIQPDTAPAPGETQSAGPAVGAPAVVAPAVAKPAVAKPAVAKPAVAKPAVAAPAIAAPAPAPAMDRRVGAERRVAVEGASLRVSTDKVDRLIDLVGEIVIAQSMVSTLAEHFTPAKLAQLRDAVTSLEANTRELQERVMAIRMVPVGGVFSRFPRLVRDLAASLGKEVRVDMQGAETELDKGVIERIGDPVTHLVRNAVDHGLEPGDVREAAGKPREGVIRLAAYTRGGMVMIDVSDDGRGLDEDRIRAKALEQGLITPDQTLTPEALYQLIFHPGFSTAAAVSDLSGRGVGMDVVKRNIEELNGTVTVESRRGAGTCVRLALPLTLAILEGQSLTVGETTYVLPLTAIVESLRPKPSEVCTVLGTGEVIRVRGDAIPLVRLHQYLGATSARTDPTQGIVVLVEHQGRRAALLADELLAQHQVVIKSLDTNYRRVEGVMGATIMGDGSVALILDVAGLLRLAQPGTRPEAAAAA